jgi:hypothetical protein
MRIGQPPFAEREADMNQRALLARFLVIAGSIAVAIGALDPMEGAFIIFPGSGMAALGAYLAQARKRKLTYWGFLLLAVALLEMIVIGALGGFGGQAPVLHSNWWVLLLLPYPAGWLMCVAGIRFTLEDLSKGRWGMIYARIWVLAPAAILLTWLVALLARLLGFI